MGESVGAPSVLQARVVDWGKCVGWVPHTLPWVIHLPGPDARVPGVWPLCHVSRSTGRRAVRARGQTPGTVASAS